MPDNALDAPAQSKDKAPPAEQQDQESWVSKIFNNIQKEAAGRSAPQSEGFKAASPTMLAMENTGSLPVCRTSC